MTRGYCALISPEDADFVGRWNWAALVPRSKKVNAVRRENWSGSFYYMHREIMAAADGLDVDHINADTLDNRRQNLRVCSHKDNSRNKRMGASLPKTSPYRGVWTQPTRKTWQASIRVDYKTIHLGGFASAEDAARAYDAAALEHFGEFALTNAKLGLLA
jgi:hypothetical protein